MTAQLPSRERWETLIRAIECESYDEEEIVSWVNSDEILSMARFALAAQSKSRWRGSGRITGSGMLPMTRSAPEIWRGMVLKCYRSTPTPRQSLRCQPNGLKNSPGHIMTM